MTCPKPVQQTLAHLVEVGQTPCLTWLQANREQLERAVGYPLAFSGVAAAAFCDDLLKIDRLALTPEQQNETTRIDEWPEQFDKSTQRFGGDKEKLKSIASEKLKSICEKIK